MIWRGNNYKPHQGGIFLTERELYDDPADSESAVNREKHENSGGNNNKPHERGIFPANEEELSDDGAECASILNVEHHKNTDN